MITSNLKNLSLTLIGILLSISAIAQNQFAISGKVVNEKGEAMPAATVFINGSSRIMPASDGGKFSFQNLAPGSYQVSVQMLGYYPLTQKVTVDESSVDIKMVLNVKPTALREVVIGGSSNLDKYYDLFERELLGESENGRSCKLQGREVVNLSVGPQYLKADADDFFIVINKRLGYKIRYLLKSFTHTLGTNYSTIDGDAVFEELEGTDKMKKEWAKRRAETYEVSFRHFLRAVYSGTVLKEGFVVNALFPEPPNSAPGYLFIDPRPVNFDTLLRDNGQAFKSLHFKSMYANYNPKKAASLNNQDKPFSIRRIVREYTSTLISMDHRPVLIDRAGNCVDCNISQNGKWGLMRLGDQLPSDYDPAKPVKNL